MPNLTAWLDWNGDEQPDQWLDGQDRGAGIGLMLGRHGVSVVLYRDNVAQTAQTMMINPAGQNTNTQQVSSEAGTAGRDELLIVGALGLNIKRGDQFALHTSGRRNYRVTYVTKSFGGMVQARAEAIDNA